MLVETPNPSTQIATYFITLYLLEHNLLVEFAILIFYTIVAKMPASPILLLRHSRPHKFLLPTINYSTKDRDENRNDYSPNRISIYQRKRFIWICATIIGTFFVFQSMKLQTIETDEVTDQKQGASSNRPSVTDHDQDDDVTIIPLYHLRNYQLMR